MIININCSDKSETSLVFDHGRQQTGLANDKEYNEIYFIHLNTFDDFYPVI